MQLHEVGLFSGVSSHVLCHMVVMYLWILRLKSEGGVRQSCMSVLCALLGALSARYWGYQRGPVARRVNVEV